MNKLLALVLVSALTTTGAIAGGPSTATLDVTKMDCAVCPITVRKALEKVPGVESAKVDVKTRKAVVTFDPTRTSPSVLTKATANAGFPSTVDQLR